MASGFPADVIRCRACGARDVQTQGKIGRSTVLSCSQCGTGLWTWCEFLQRVDDMATPLHAEAAAVAEGAPPSSTDQSNPGTFRRGEPKLHALAYSPLPRGPEELHREVMRTPTPKDEEVVRRLQANDAKITTALRQAVDAAQAVRL